MIAILLLALSIGTTANLLWKSVNADCTSSSSSTGLIFLPLHSSAALFYFSTGKVNLYLYRILQMIHQPLTIMVLWFPFCSCYSQKFLAHDNLDPSQKFAWFRVLDNSQVTTDHAFMVGVGMLTFAQRQIPDE